MANNVLVLSERLKKKVDSEICIFTKSGGSGLVSLGDFALFKFCQVFLLDHEYSPWGLENRIGSKCSCK